MPRPSSVAKWEEVRDQELSEIITRRREAGLLPPEGLANVVQRWATAGLLPPEIPGEMLLRLLEAGELPASRLPELVATWKPVAKWCPEVLAGIVERRAGNLLDSSSQEAASGSETPRLDPKALAVLVARWQALGLLPPEAKYLDEAKLQEVVRQPALRKLANYLKPLDPKEEIHLLSDAAIQNLERLWISRGGVLPEKSGVPGKPAKPLSLDRAYLQDHFQDLESQARNDLAKAFRQRRVQTFADFVHDWRDTYLLPARLLTELTDHRRRAGLFAGPEPPNPGAPPATPAQAAAAEDLEHISARLASGWLQPADVAGLVGNWSEKRQQLFIQQRQNVGPLTLENSQVLVLNALVLEALMREEVSADLVGLALSGGGIRSASFNLGLLQALHRHGLLRQTDYLATVSGGGYIGSLLSSLTLRPDVHLNHEKYPQKGLGLRPEDNGKQPDQVLKVVHSGSFLNRPWLYASRYLVGLLANNLVLFSGLLALCAGLAWLWRCLDLPPWSEYLELRSGGWISDANRSFLPAGLMLCAWLFAWLLSFQRREAVSPRWLTTIGLGMIPLAIAGSCFACLWAMTPRGTYQEWYKAPSLPWEAISLPWGPIFLISLCLALAWLIAWIFKSIERHARHLAHGWSATVLLTLVLLSGAIGVVVLLGNPNINWESRLQLKDQSTSPSIHTWHQDLLLPLLLLLIAGLLPTLWIRRILAHEAHGKSTWPPLLLKTTSWAMLIGIPLLILFLLARHNVSGEGGPDRDARMMYTDFHNWDAFWDRVRGEHRVWERTRDENAHTPGSWIWQQLGPDACLLVEQIDQRRELGRLPDVASLGNKEWKLLDLPKLSQEKLGRLHADGYAQNLAVPLLKTDQESRQHVTQALNEHVLKDVDFFRRVQTFQEKSFLDKMAKNHKKWHQIEMGLFKAMQGIGPSAQEVEHALLVLRTATSGLVQAPLVQTTCLAAATRISRRDATVAESDRGEKEVFFQSRVKLNRLLLEAYFPFDIWEKTSVHRTVLLPEEESGIPPSLGKERGVFLVAQDQATRAWYFWISLGIVLVSACIVNLNATSLHGIYRTQLAKVYNEPLPGSHTIPLCRLDTTAKGAPYHLLGATLNKGASAEEHDRPTANFFFSRRYCGSQLTDFVRTEDYLGGDLDLATAMAISGAAFSPARVTNPFVAFLMVVLNLRLGQWLPSPRYPARPRWLPVLRLGWSLALNWLRHGGASQQRYWFISDGGHNENLGLGMLLRRECRLLLVSDAGHDPDYGFDDFVRLYRQARLQGVRFYTLDHKGFISVDPLVPDKATRNSPHRFFLARVSYPPDQVSYPPDLADNPPAKEGLLIYIKPSFAGDEEVDLKRYRAENDQFPHDPTTNQWFDEDQVESYRELGFWIGTRLGQEVFEGTGAVPDDLNVLVTAWEKTLQAQSCKAVPGTDGKGTVLVPASPRDNGAKSPPVTLAS